MRGSFTSPQEVRQAIDAFVTVYSENARPFERRKAEARQTTPQQTYADVIIPVAQAPRQILPLRTAPAGALGAEARGEVCCPCIGEWGTT